MGGIFSKRSKEDTEEERLREKYTCQTKIRHLLFAPGHAFNDEVLEDILSIPLTDFHMGLTYEEVTIIILEQRPHIYRTKARMLAHRITHGKSLKILKAGEILRD